MYYVIYYFLQVTPLPVTAIEFVNPRHCNKRKKQSNDVEVETKKKVFKQDTGPHHCPRISKDKLHHSMHDLVSNACLFTILPKESFPPSIGKESEELTNLCESSYDDDDLASATVDDIFSELCSKLPNESELSSDSDEVSVALPSSLMELYTEEYRNMSSTTVSEKAKEIFQSLSLSQEDCQNIERSTRLQNQSEDWHKQRQGRLTASIFHNVLTKKSKTSCDSLVRTCLIKKDIGHVPAIKWGIDHESDGKREYFNQHKGIHQEFKVTNSGLIINPSFVHLGASPDGLTECTCCGKGLLEIKCPFAYKSGTPCDMIGKRGSFLNHQGLVKSHKYYTQVQGQLAICNREFCDFVVWTPQKTFVQRIYKDYAFIDRMLSKLTTFYVEQSTFENLFLVVKET